VAKKQATKKKPGRAANAKAKAASNRRASGT
jgi:hypothetical protein